MGPSGSGKTTLLKTISGQMFVGELKGIRTINDEIIPGAKYDQVGSVALYSRSCVVCSILLW